MVKSGRFPLVMKLIQQTMSDLEHYAILWLHVYFIIRTEFL